MRYRPVLQPQLLVFLASLLVAITPCRAQHMNENDSPCAEVVVTSDLVDCLSKARTSSDSELNSLYQNIQKKLDASEARHLTEAQRLWIKYRDANCSAERELYGRGTAAFPAYLGCLEAMTRARTKELQVTYTVRLKK
jgi:uncharacterized protein YecT (DUF1311 family)